MNSKKTYFLVFVVSFVIILMELLLTRIFSVILWYHMAFMAVSIALIGIGLSGLYIYFKKYKQLDEQTLLNKSFSALLYAAISLFISYYFIFNTKIYLRSEIYDVLYLLFILFLLVIPFIFLGYIIALIFSNYNKNINKLYFIDLIGAAIGCLFFIPVINKIGPEKIIFILSLVLLFIPVVFLKQLTKLKRILTYIFICLFLILFFVDLKTNFYKIKYVKGHSESDILYSKWNSFSRVGVYKLRFMDWGLSNVYKGSFPELLTLDIDACAGMTMINYDGNDDKVKFIKSSITTLPYLLSSESPVAIIGAGAGKDVLGAKICGIKKIFAVDINSIIRDIVLKQYKKFTGNLYGLPGVKFILSDGRSYIRKSKQRFKVIQLSMVDTFAAVNSGALALAENTLYTVEAFSDYFKKLTDDGILSLTRFLFSPPRQSLRTITLAVDVYKKMGIKGYYKNIVIIANKANNKYSTVHFLLKKTKWTKSELSKLKEISSRLNFDIIYMPEKKYYKLNNTFVHYIFSKNQPEFLVNYKFDVSPTTDDRPFFFYMIKTKNFFNALKVRTKQRFNFVAIFVLIVSFVFSLISAILFIGIPFLYDLFTKSHQSSEHFFEILYFFLIGLAFMLLENSMIQKYILFLGHPVYSLSIVLFSFLIFTGIGSFISGFIKTEKLNTFLIISIFLGIIFLLGLNSTIEIIFNKFLYLDQLPKNIIAVFSLALPGIFLGFLFPSGIRMFTQKNKNLVGWAWAVNGAASVVGSLLSYVLALNYGFLMCLESALFLYICVLFILLKKRYINFR